VNSLYPALALLLTAFAIAPLAFPGFFQSYTGYGAVYNLIELSTRGTPFFAWSPEWGRAYDFLRMDGPLGYWLGSLFAWAGISFVASVRMVYALAFLASGWGMFRLARHVLANDSAALLTAMVYVYFPAHIAAVYVRGAFGEAVAWGLFPFGLWCALELEKQETRSRWGVALCILVFALLMLAQPGLAILFGIFARFCLVAWGARARAPRGFFRSAGGNALLVGLLLGLAAQLPALLTHASASAPNGFVPAFVYPFQLLSASWGTDLPRAAVGENAPYQIGFAALGLAILAIALLLVPGQPGAEAGRARRVTWFAVGASFVLVGLMSPTAAPLWQWSGLDLVVQYPFQLLALVGFALALAAGTIVLADNRLREIPLLAVLLVIPLLSVYPYLAPEFTSFSPVRPALARFNDGELALLDARVVRPPGTWRHGATVELDLTWQALKQPNRDYTVFLHVLDENGQPWGGSDDKPQGGALSTFDMVPGRVYSDTHRVQIDLAGPPEGFHIELGIYQTTTGERAVTETGATGVRIDENRP
jgi:uncharacterized membrane protein